MKKKYVKEISCCRECPEMNIRWGYDCKLVGFDIYGNVDEVIDPGCLLPNVEEEILVDKDALEYVDRCKVPVKIMKEYPHQAVVTTNEAKRALRIQRENFEKRVKEVLDKVIYGPYPVPQKKKEILKQLGIEEEKK